MNISTLPSDQWVPLEKLFGGNKDRCGEFMFMWINSEAGIFAYKHIETRKYIYCDVNGNLYNKSSITNNQIKWIRDFGGIVD